MGDPSSPPALRPGPAGGDVTAARRKTTHSEEAQELGGTEKLSRNDGTSSATLALKKTLAPRATVFGLGESTRFGWPVAGQPLLSVRHGGTFTNCQI